MSFDLKVLWIFVLSALAIRLAAFWLSDRPQNRLQNSNVVLASAEAGNPYLGLRNQILQLKREKIGFAALAKPTEPWAAVMDWGATNGTATVVAIAGGTASIYLSSGGGSIGRGPCHDLICEADKKMVSVAAEFQPQMRATDTYPLPQRGQVTFCVFSDARIFTASALQAELSSHRHPFSELDDASQDIITRYRLIQKPK
jgi:hypothetical protein